MIKTKIQSSAAVLLPWLVAAGLPVLLTSCGGHYLKKAPAPTTAETQGASAEAQAAIRRGNVHLVAGRFQDAHKSAQQAIKLSPSNDSYFFQGTVFYREGNYSSAVEAWKKALEFDAKNERTLLNLSRLYLLRNDNEGALETFNALTQHYPQDDTYHFQKGLLHKKVGQYNQANAALLKVKSTYSRYALVLIHLGDVALAQDNFDKAKEYYAKAKELDPKLAAAAAGLSTVGTQKLLKLATNAMQAGNFQQAIDYCDKAVAADPQNSSVYFVYSAIYIKMDDLAKAEEKARQGLKINNTSEEGAYYLGTILIARKKYGQAGKFLKQAMVLHPQSAEIVNLYGMLQRHRGRLKKALSTFAKAIDINEKYAPAYANSGFSYLDLERYQDAETYFQRAVALDPNPVWQKAQRLAAALYYKKQSDDAKAAGKFNQALELMDKAVQARPDLPLLDVARGQIYFAAGNPGAADAQYNKALAKDENFAPAYLAKLVLYKTNIVKYAAQRKAIQNKIAELAKTDPQFAHRLGEAAQVDNNWQLAEVYYRRCLKIQADFTACRQSLAKVLHRDGNQAAKNGQFKKATAKLSEAVSLDKSNEQIAKDYKIAQENEKYAYLYPTIVKAQAYFDNQLYGQALPLYEKLFEKLPRPGFLIAIVNCHFALDQDRKGLLAIQKGQEMFKENLVFQESLYSYYLKRGHFAKAEQGFDTLKKSYPNEPYAYYKTGIIHLRKGKMDKALKQFNEAIFRDETLGEAYVARGLIFFKRGKKEKARLEFIRARNYPSSELLAYENLGLSYVLSSDPKSARATFTELNKKYPNEDLAFYYLGYLEYLEKDINTAIYMLRKAVSLNGNLKNYMAYAKVLEERYNKTKSAKSKRQLIRTYRRILALPEASRVGKQIRPKLLSLGKKDTYVEVFRFDKKLRVAPLQIGPYLVLSQKFRIDVVDAQTKDRIWSHVFSGAVQGFEFNNSINIMFKDRVLFYRLSDGKLLKTVKLGTPANGDVWTANGRLFYSSEKDGVKTLIEKSLIDYTEKEVLKGKDIYFTDSRGRHPLTILQKLPLKEPDEDKKDWASIKVMQWNGNSWATKEVDDLDELPVVRIKRLRHGFLVVLKKKYLWYYPGYEEPVEIERQPGIKSVFTYNNRLYVVFKQKVIEFSKDSKEEHEAPKEIQQIVGFAGGDSEKKMLFCGVNGYAYRLTDKGFEKIKVFQAYGLTQLKRYTYISLYTLQ